MIRADGVKGFNEVVFRLKRTDGDKRETDTWLTEITDEAKQRVYYGQVFVPPPNTLEEYLR